MSSPYFFAVGIFGVSSRPYLKRGVIACNIVTLHKFFLYFCAYLPAYSSLESQSSVVFGNNWHKYRHKILLLLPVLNLFEILIFYQMDFVRYFQ